MNRGDEWGRDPSVRVMRGVFGLMESIQNKVFEQIGIDRYDPRLRAWRDQAKKDFEHAWSEAAGSRIQLTQEQLATLYLRCLADVLRSDGIPTPDEGPEVDKASKSAFHLETDR